MQISGANAEGIGDTDTLPDAPRQAVAGFLYFGGNLPTKKEKPLKIPLNRFEMMLLLWVDGKAYASARVYIIKKTPTRNANTATDCKIIKRTSPMPPQYPPQMLRSASNLNEMAKHEGNYC